MSQLSPFLMVVDCQAIWLLANSRYFILFRFRVVEHLFCLLFQFKFHVLDFFSLSTFLVILRSNSNLFYLLRCINIST